MDKSIEQALMGEEVRVEIDVVDSGELHYFSLDQVDFHHKWNIRREDKYEARIARKAQELMVDGFVRQALIVMEITDAGESILPRGTCGFIRHGALCYIRDRHPVIYKDKFEGKVPYRLLRGTEEMRQRMMLDHGSEELLDEYELAETARKYFKMGKTEMEVAVLLSSLFYQLTDQSTKRKYNEGLAELREKGQVGKAFSADQFNLHFWRRRVQHLKRIVSAPPAAMQWHKEYVDGVPGRYAIGTKCAEQFNECTTNEDVLNKIVQHAPTPRGEGTAKGWARTRILQAREMCQSRYMKDMYSVILGEKPAETLLQMEEELCKVETAQKNEQFWAILAKL